MWVVNGLEGLTFGQIHHEIIDHTPQLKRYVTRVTKCIRMTHNWPWHCGTVAETHTNVGCGWKWAVCLVILWKTGRYPFIPSTWPNTVHNNLDNCFWTSDLCRNPKPTINNPVNNIPIYFEKIKYRSCVSLSRSPKRKTLSIQAGQIQGQIRRNCTSMCLI